MRRYVIDLAEVSSALDLEITARLGKEIDWSAPPLEQRKTALDVVMASCLSELFSDPTSSDSTNFEIAKNELAVLGLPIRDSRRVFQDTITALCVHIGELVPDLRAEDPVTLWGVVQPQRHNSPMRTVVDTAGNSKQICLPDYEITPTGDVLVPGAWYRLNNMQLTLNLDSKEQ